MSFGMGVIMGFFFKIGTGMPLIYQQGHANIRVNKSTKTSTLTANCGTSRYRGIRIEQSRKMKFEKEDTFQKRPTHLTKPIQTPTNRIPIYPNVYFFLIQILYIKDP